MKGIGRTDVKVTFGDASEDQAVATMAKELPSMVPAEQPATTPPTLARIIDNIFYGWIPVN